MNPFCGPELPTLREQNTDAHAKNSTETSTPAPRLSVPKHLDMNLCERGITPRPADALRVCGRTGCNAVSRAKLSSPRRHPLLLCAGCKSVAYCSKECQAAAWAAGHRQKCAGVHAAQSGPRAGGEAAVRRPAPTGHTAQQRRLVIHLQERRQIGDLPCAERIQAEMLGVARTVEKTWPEGAMSIYNNLGLCCQMAGQYQQALELHDKHLAIATRVGDRGGEGAATGTVGNCLDSLGEYENSEKMHEISLAIAVEVGDKDAEGACCGNLANVKDSLSKSGQEMKKRLLEIAKESGEALKFGDLEHCSFRLGQYAQALVIPRADDARTSLGELVKLGPLFDAALSRPKPALLSLDGTKSKASAGFRARTGDMSRTVPNVPRELVLFSGVRLTTPGHRDGVFVKHVRRPRAILPEGGVLGVLQPRDLSLILADAYKEDRDVHGPSKCADEQKVAQRARKPRGFALLNGLACKGNNENKHRLGYLGLRVVSAAHLSAGDAFGSADPFVDLWVSNKQHGKQKFMTSTKFKTRNPTWDESFKFSVWNAQDTLELRVFDYDEVGSNDFLGLKVISMKDLFRQVNGGKEPEDFASFTKTETYQLMGHSGSDYVDAECTLKVSGSIVLEFTFEALPKPRVAALKQKPNLQGLSAAKKPAKNLLPEKQTKEFLEKLAGSRKSAYSGSLLPLKWVSFDTCLVCAGVPQGDAG
jgi:tetratricopeptide (TPR) repeat protein